MGLLTQNWIFTHLLPTSMSAEAPVTFSNPHKCVSGFTAVGRQALRWEQNKRGETRSASSSKSPKDSAVRSASRQQSVKPKYPKPRTPNCGKLTRAVHWLEYWTSVQLRDGYRRRGERQIGQIKSQSKTDVPQKVKKKNELNSAWAMICREVSLLV